MILKKRRNYSRSIFWSSLIGLGIIIYLVSTGGFGALDLFSPVPIEVCILSMPLILNRCMASLSSYLGRICDWLLGGDRTFMEYLQNKSSQQPEKLTKENLLTPIGALLGIGIGILLLLSGARIPFLGGLDWIAYILFVASTGGITAGLFARIGRAKDLWHKKNNEALAIAAGFVIGLSCVIAGIANVGLVGLSLFGPLSWAVGLASIPLIIGTTISFLSYIGRGLDPVTKNKSLWHGLLYLFKVIKEYFNRKIIEDIELEIEQTPLVVPIEKESPEPVLRGKYEIWGTRFGILLGLTISITILVLATSIVPTFGLPLWVAGFLFVSGIAGGTCSLLARWGHVLDAYLVHSEKKQPNRYSRLDEVPDLLDPDSLVADSSSSDNIPSRIKVESPYPTPDQLPFVDGQTIRVPVSEGLGEKSTSVSPDLLSSSPKKDDLFAAKQPLAIGEKRRLTPPPITLPQPTTAEMEDLPTPVLESATEGGSALPLPETAQPVTQTSSSTRALLELLDRPKDPAFTVLQDLPQPKDFAPVKQDFKELKGKERFERFSSPGISFFPNPLDKGEFADKYQGHDYPQISSYLPTWAKLPTQDEFIPATEALESDPSNPDPIRTADGKPAFDYHNIAKWGA